MKFQTNKVVLFLVLSVSLLAGFQNCSPASMKFSKTDLSDKPVSLLEQSAPPADEQAVIEQQAADAEIKADEEAAAATQASDSQPCHVPPVKVPKDKDSEPMQPAVVHVPDIKDPREPASSQPSQPSVSQPSQPSQPSNPDVMDESSLEGANKFTVIKEDAVLLACGKNISSITTVASGAKVVIVEGSLGSLTSLAKEAELILVNSDLKSRIPALRGKVTVVSDAAEKQKWLDQCGQSQYQAIPANAQAFRINMIRAEDASIVPRAASAYKITQIKSGVVLPSLHSSSMFDVTVLGDGVSLDVKTKDFRLNVLSKGSKLTLR